METEKRLIDANALMEVLKEKHDWVMQDPEISPSIKWGEAVCNGRVCEAIEKAPTVDAVEVVHGWWDKYEDDKFIGYDANGRIQYRKVYTYYCGRCGRGTAVKTNYCPNCGADMRERKDNGE